MPDQSSAKVAPCQECGGLVRYRTCAPRRCEPCRVGQKLISGRKAAEAQRRKRGVPQVKGTSATCDRCSVPMLRSTRTHRFCEGCSPIAANERSREYQRRKHRADGREQIGTAKACAHCGVQIVLSKKGRLSYCKSCAELAKLGSLPLYRERQAATKRKRYSGDARYALTERMRRGILHSVGGMKAGRRWESLVGYSLSDLIVHLERQFLPGMTWDNRDKWHIDHIVPLAAHTFETAECEGFRAAWALTNLRPLWAKDNLDKRAKRLFLL